VAHEVLADDERERAARFHYEPDRARYVTTRAALRTVLAVYLDLGAGEIELETDDDDRPQLAGRSARQLDFNVSHATDVALIAVSRQRVGVDVERKARRVSANRELIDHWFTTRESACIIRGCGGSTDGGFLRHWTAKEAYLKAVGCGISGLRDIEVCCGSDVELRWQGRLDGSRTLRRPLVSPFHVAALVADARVTRCRLFRAEKSRLLL
jgi:4'-phosphopantetheinyl transferase